MVLFDANVLIDVLHRDPVWFEWSAARVDEHEAEGIAINQVIYAELSIGFPTSEACDDALTEGIVKLDLPWEAAFRAGRAFLQYRRSGGTRLTPLPDFFIGAHAQVAGMKLVTRDATRYRTYFPDIEIIAPA
jgi:predicted nucleic acid-binding protein